MHDDGVIKYQCEWDSGAALAVEHLASLIAWRDRFHKVGLIGVYPDGVGFGNISSRLTPESFLISGTQTGHFQTTSPADYTLVDQWNIDRNTLHCVGPVKASSESLTHAALYEYTPNIRAIIHVHHRELWTKYQDILPTTQANVPYGTPAMAYEMWRLFRESDLSDKRVLVMAGHEEGLIAFGETLEATAAIFFNLLGVTSVEKL